MKNICTLLTVSSLSIASLTAQTVSDNFNDNSRDTALWQDPFIDEGNGQLLEQNERVEFTTSVTADTDVSQALKQFPTYNQAWQVQMVASMSKDNFSALGQIGAVSIDIGAGDHWLGMGYGAGILSPGPSGTALAAGWSVGSGDANNITTIVLPTAIGIRIAYDPRRRLIRTYYDTDADQTDGEWTLYESFTIDGSPNPGGVVLDWGMTEFDNFYMAIDGFSSGAAIPAGTAWADDFEYTLGQTLLTPTFADDFEDGTLDTTIWNDPVPDSSELLTETGGRLEFTTAAGAERWVVQSVKSSPTYDQAWQIQTLISVDQSQFGNNQLGYMGMTAGGPGEDRNVEVGMGVGHSDDLPPLPFRETIFSSGDSGTEGEPDFFTEELPDVIGVRMTYDPNSRIIRTYYDLDADNADDEWTLFKSYTIDNSIVTGAETLNWGMTQFDTFYLEIYGGAEGNIAVASGTAWMDDFSFNLGSTVRSDALMISDDFNDDSVDSNWSVPEIDEGSPSLTEVSHRTELVSTSSSGAHELSREISQYLPRYDQAFEVRLDAHCLPAAVTAGGGLSLVELMVGSTSSENDLLTSIGRGDVGGGFGHLRFSDDWKFLEGSLPEIREEAISLPDIVSIRMAWNPDTEVMNCYFDTDNDPSVDSWDLFSSYTLNGTGALGSDWNMAPSDRFFIGFAMLAEDAAVTPGEVYIDNFAFWSEAPPTGYDQWASGIPDAGMRETTDDASGNGIPNLLQYMYGLDPLATDTDVALTVELNGNVPDLVHGFNETAADYAVDYMDKLLLSDGWSPGFIPDSISTFQSGGKTFRRVTLPAISGDSFFQLQVVPAQ